MDKNRIDPLDVLLHLTVLVVAGLILRALLGG